MVNSNQTEQYAEIRLKVSGVREDQSTCKTHVLPDTGDDQIKANMQTGRPQRDRIWVWRSTIESAPIGVKDSSVLAVFPSPFLC